MESTLPTPHQWFTAGSAGGRDLSINLPVYLFSFFLCTQYWPVAGPGNSHTVIMRYLRIQADEVRMAGQGGGQGGRREREQERIWVLDSLLEPLHWPQPAMFECFVMRHKWNSICLSYHSLVRLRVICTGNTSLTKPMFCLGWERATVEIMYLYSWETENQMCLNIFDKTVGWVFQKHSFLCSEKPLGGNSSCRKQMLDIVRAWLQ